MLYTPTGHRGDVWPPPRLDRATVVFDDRHLPAGDRQPHRAGTHRHRAVVGDDATGLGLAVAVVHGQATGALTPGSDHLGVQRLAGARAVAQSAQVVLREVALDEQPVER